MKFTFVHAADLHLDTPFSGIGKARPDIEVALQEASLDAFDALIDLTIEQKALFLLIAGDIYDGAQRGLRAQLRFEKGLKRLVQHHIRTYIVHGNHDPLDGWSAIRHWPEEVKVFGGDIESSFVELNGEVVATIHGISHQQRNQGDNLTFHFQRGSQGIQIGLLHCQVGTGDGDVYCPCTIEDLCSRGLDYWALGHIHRRGVLKADAPWIVYPGNHQGRSLKPSETGEKGAMVVEVEDGRILSPRFVSLERARFEAIEASIEGMADIPTLRNSLLSQADELWNTGKNLVLRAFLVGRGDIHQDLKREGILEALLQDLREECAGRMPFLWWDSLIDRTASNLDLEAIRRRNDFSAELLHLKDKLSPKASSFWEVLAPIRRYERVCGETGISNEELLEQACIMALDLLEGEVLG